MASLDFWAMIAAGTAFIAIGVVQLVKYRAFRDRSERASGTVVGMSEGMMGQHNAALYFPVLSFTTRGGQSVRTTTRVGSRPAPARVGDQVVVAYDPDLPEEAEIADKGGLRLFVLGALILAGLVFYLFAWLYARGIVR